ncbi:hypothetical protein IC229_12450 [Spirosoma sp. BT702]|uniref:Uncharacterized protein n=1 Tax=Spirosoma profusum TaxID=2771354 RepID=A0A926XVM3_9BACT|nr:hypothetical protein [Spirosoma profusum]
MKGIITFRDRMADFMANQQCINGFYIQSMLYLGKVAFLANQTAYSIKEAHLCAILDQVYIFPPIQV